MKFYILILILLPFTSFSQIKDSTELHLENFKKLYEKSLISKEEYDVLKAKELNIIQETGQKNKIYSRFSFNFNGGYMVAIGPAYLTQYTGYSTGKRLKTALNSSIYSGLKAHLSLGAKLKRVFIGGGVGIEQHVDIMGIFFLQNNCFLSNGKAQPFTHLKIGYGKNIQTVSSSSNIGVPGFIGGGVAADIGFGTKLKLLKDFGLTFITTYSFRQLNSSESIKLQSNFISLSLGVDL